MNATLNFATGTEGLFYSALVAGILLTYLYLMAPVLVQNFQTRDRGRWSVLATTFVLLALSILLVVPTSATGFVLVFPMSWYTLVFAGFWALVCFIAAKVAPAKHYAYGDQEVAGAEVPDGGEGAGARSPGGEKPGTFDFTYRMEIKRKFVHILGLLYITAFIFGTFIFNLVWDESVLPLGVFSSEENTANVRVLAFGEPLYTGASLYIMALLCSFFVQINAEITRLRFPGTPFILQRSMMATKRPSEGDTFAANIHLIPAITLAAVILTWSPQYRFEGTMAAVSVLFASLLGDMAAALVGRKWGAHKWPILRDKSLEGSAAGMGVTFLSALVWVGPLVALASALVFLFTDIILAKVNLSDNLTTPLLLGVVYSLMLPLVHPLVPAIWHVPPLKLP
ncbi:MAG: hypothetical protein ACTSU5_07920 [Promethearchaeota archaeon]